MSMTADIRRMNREDLAALIKSNLEQPCENLLQEAGALARKHYGNKVYVRGLVEISSYCGQDCYYCGIRKSNRGAGRYRLTESQILSCCSAGYEIGFRSFVLQGGEDPWYSDEIICHLIREIKKNCPGSAVTLSLGEKPRESYEAFYNAGADRYLLRHESGTDAHYAQLHPKEQTLASRKACLFALKEIGFQTGAGFMVGSPFQTPENLAEDLILLRELEPHMVGVGPFVPHRDTPFADFPQGSLNASLLMLALTRIMLPQALLPSTTALASISENGRERGLMAGANVVMPNLSPVEFRESYALYNNKISSGAEAAESVKLLQRRLSPLGLELDFSRGDFRKTKRNI